MTNAGYLPERIVAGESIWLAAANTVQSGVDLIFDNFTPAGGYTLAYRFAAATPISVAGAANGANTGWTLEVTAAQTLIWTPGVVRYAGMVTHTSTSRVFAVDEGSIGVTPSPLATSGWAPALTACEAALATYAGNARGSVNIGDLSYTYRSRQELIDLHAWLKARVDYDTGSRQKRIIRTRFT